MRLLESYIKGFLKENFNRDLLKVLVDKLDKKSQECIDFFTSEGRESAIEYHSYRYILEVIEEMNLDRIGYGESREAYSFENEDWVLKVAVNSFGSKVLKQEIEISQISQDEASHGAGARDIFVEVYDYDRKNVSPVWMICEKVEVLHEFEDMSALVKIFPTFWDAIKEERKSEVKVVAFKSFIDDTLYGMINAKFNSLRQKQKAAKNLQGIEGEVASAYRDALMFSRVTNKSIPNNVIKKLKRKSFDAKEYILRPNANKEAFYKGLISAMPDESMIKDINDIRFGEDFKRICRAFAFVKTEDLHDENIGIRRSSHPSPSDFVIIDFML